MWWVSSLLSLVTTPKPHHSEPLICIHGWLTAGAPFPLECSTWGEVHERTHIAHLSAWLDPEMGWEGSCLDSALSVKPPFWRKSIFYTSSDVKCAGINLIEVLSSCQNLDLEYLCNILFIFFTKIDLKIWVWHRYISKIYNYNLFRLNQSQSQSSFTPNRITKKIMFWVKTTNKADVERFRVSSPQTHLEIWRFAIKYPVVSY